MAGLKAIKTKIRSIQKTEKVTKAMEAVSAAKMRKAQVRALAGRPYARAAVAILSRLSGAQALSNHPLVRAHTLDTTIDVGSTTSPTRALYIVLTSDKGLAGALNSAVLRRAERDIRDSGMSRSHVSIIAVGRKANDFFTTRGYAVEVYHPNTDTLTSELVDEIVLEAANRFSTGVVDLVKIVYQQFITTFEQRPTMHTVFPLSLPELSQVVKDIIPARGAFSAPAAEDEPRAYEVEPSEGAVLDLVLPKLASIFVYHALLETQASEHSARMVSMKSATDKAGEMEHGLTLQFNKARQAAITREVSEITGGMEAMAS